MFERFTDQARKVLSFASEEARGLHHHFVGTEHILLGLLRESEGGAAMVLESFGVTEDVTRERVVEHSASPSASTTSSQPFTGRAKKVLELSLREAVQLGHSYIGTEHLLLGLIHEGDGMAVELLVASGVDLAALRQRVLQLLTAELGDKPRATSMHSGPATPASLGPLCGSCHRPLADTALYRSIDVAPAETSAGQGPVTIELIYCGRCGTVLCSLNPPPGRRPPYLGSDLRA